MLQDEVVSKVVYNIVARDWLHLQVLEGQFLCNPLVLDMGKLFLLYIKCFFGNFKELFIINYIKQVLKGSNMKAYISYSKDYNVIIINEIVIYFTFVFSTNL